MRHKYFLIVNDVDPYFINVIIGYLEFAAVNTNTIIDYNVATRKFVMLTSKDTLLADVKDVFLNRTEVKKSATGKKW